MVVVVMVVGGLRALRTVIEVHITALYLLTLHSTTVQLVPLAKGRGCVCASRVLGLGVGVGVEVEVVGI